MENLSKRLSEMIDRKMWFGITLPEWIWNLIPEISEKQIA